MNDKDSHKDMSHNSARILEAVGLTALEERTYLLLLDQPGLTATEIAELIGQPERLAAACLSELEARGVVGRLPDGPGYLPSPPEGAIAELIARKHDELRLAEGSIARLVRRAREGVARRGHRGMIVETITGEDALAERLDQLQRAAVEQICGLITTTCPYLTSHRTFDQSRSGSVSVRMVYDRRTLESPDLFEMARRQAASGGLVRVASSLPVTLVVFDRRVALVPEFDDVQGALLVGKSALLDALLAAFEAIWDRSAPLGYVSTERSANGPDAPEQQELLALLAAGFKDGAIARRLGLSDRTLDRRLHTLMKSLEAGTRFQAGWVAAHRAGARRQ